MSNRPDLFELLTAAGYDCGFDDERKRAVEWALKWFDRRNSLPESSADKARLELLTVGSAQRGTDDGFVYYCMQDPLWADYPYDAANTPEIERMHNSACGPTSMAMAISTLTRRAVLPPVLADWANASGFRDPNGIDGTDESFFPACAHRYGLKSTVLAISDAAYPEGKAPRLQLEDCRANVAEAYARADSALRSGGAVISNVVPGSPYTTCGHYNLIERISDGLVYVKDPSANNAGVPPHALDEWIARRFAKFLIIITK